MGEKPISAAQWATVVRNVPVVSVDLIVETEAGVVLGKRENDPAKREWFVPGGRVHKHEQLSEAVHRVAREELGVEVSIERQLGVYEHFWETAEVADAGGKHYVPIGYHVRTQEGVLFDADDQHGAIDVFAPPFEFEMHPYVETYLRDVGMLAD